MQLLQTPDFWIGLLKIIWINTILSGDNAVVIAMAARTLAPKQQKQAVLWGSGAAVVLLVALTLVAAELLAFPYLQIVGGVLLLWIGVKLFAEEEENEAGEAKHHGSLGSAIRTILVADLIMSLDNVIAVAAAAHGNLVLLVLGLGISIPVVIFGATLMVKLMDRFPIIAIAGAALVGWVAGEAIDGDVSMAGYVAGHHWMHFGLPALGAALVVAIGKTIQARDRRKPA
jgi:YjbE family integral membrane protein